MDEEYDAIILGTGLKECLLAGVLSKEGYKILHLDRNAYYGAESASLNLKQLIEKFRPEEKGHGNEKELEEKLKSLQNNHSIENQISQILKSSPI